MTHLGVIAPWKSLRSLRTHYSKSSEIGAIIDRYATYSGSDPRKVPAVLLTIAFIESTFGAWHIEGGVGRLSSLLEERNRELGSQFHFNSPVSEIIVSQGRATGVKLSSGEIVEAEYVISGSDAANTYLRLISPTNKKTKRERFKLKKATPSFSGFSLYLGLNNENAEGVIPRPSHHTIYFPENYDAEFDDLFTRKTPVADPTIYICAPGNSFNENTLKTPPKEAWSVLINAPLHDPLSGMDWDLQKEEYGKKIINKLDALGLRVTERLDYCEFRSPADIERQFNAPGGSIYGTSSNGARSAFLRAKNKSPIENLFCVGGSAHPGGGLPLVGISGEIVSEMIVKKHNHINH
jgi:phytoene desaturase